MTQTTRAKIQASRERMTKVLHALHAERDATCTTWERYSIPAFRGERMDGIGCREHDIFISVDESLTSRYIVA